MKQSKNSKEQLRTLLARTHGSVEEKQRRLAKEMHDEISQDMTVLTMELALLQSRLGTSHPEAAKLSELLTTVTRINKTVRRITNQLHPKILDEFGIIAAMKFECQRLKLERALSYIFSSNQENVSLAPELATQVFRIFQQVIEDILRPAPASEIRVEVTSARNYLCFKVTVTGTDLFEDNKNNPHFLGLLDVQEQAAWIGGEFKFECGPGNETTAFFELPLKDAQT